MRSKEASAAQSDKAGLTEVWRVELTRGLRCLADGHPERAEEHFRRAYRNAPDRPEVCFALGRERLRQGQLEEAERLLRTAWAQSRMLAAAAALARCLGVAGARRAEAHAVLDEALAVNSDGDEPGLLVVRAELHVEERDLERARGQLERAQAVLEREDREAPATRAAISAAFAKVWNLEGIALAETARLDEALFAFKRAFDVDGAWSAPLVNMGSVFARLGRSARARACYERAVVLDPENVLAHMNLADVARARGDLTTAEAEYRRVLELEHAYPGARVELASLLWSRRRGDEALEVLTTGTIKLAKEHVTGACRLAKSLMTAGRMAEAAELVRVARRVSPELTASILGDSKTNP